MSEERSDDRRAPTADIVHEEHGHRGSFYLERDGERLAKMTYSRANASLVIIDHTEVSPELKGQGVGRQLLEATVEWARRTGTKLLSTCSFASAQFAQEPDVYRDVLA